MKRMFAELALLIAAIGFLTALPAAANDPSSPGFNYKNMTSAATYAVKSGQGVIHMVCINTPVASGVVTVYDNTAASGTKIGTITEPGTLLNQGPLCGFFDVAFHTGLTIVVSGTQDITVTYN